MLIASLIPAFNGTAQAAQVTLRWDYAASGAAGFVLYCGPASRSYSTRIDVGNTDTYTIASLQEGATSFCAVTAYDAAKVESDYSNELSFYVAGAMPVVSFSASPASGTAPLNVAFTNTTTGQVTSWSWDFGDGTTSTAQNPTKVYSTPGSYRPVLTASGPGGTASKTAATAISVVAPAAPVVNFTSSPASGVAPLSVEFTNTTTGQVTSWAWDFGDGTTSIVKNPTKVYSTPGSYRPKLTATGPGGIVSKTASAAIVVNGSGSTDITAPSVQLTAPAAAATVSGTVTVQATASDNVGVAGVQFLLDGVALGAEQTGSSYSLSWNTSGVANGAHTLSARARDAAGNSTTAANRSVTVANTQASGLVASYGFEEGSGTTVSDASGNSNTGTIVGATWTQGRFGGALSFNGVSNLVRIASSSSLSLSTAMTLEAWIYPTAAQSGWRTIVQRDTDAYFLHASSRTGALVPAGGGTFNGTLAWAGGTTAAAVNAWTHVAMTYDGAMLRLYVNGVQVSSQARTGSVQTTANQVSIGGNAPWGEYFQGRIDEVRVYNRPLSAAEIQSDMNKAIVPPVGDVTAPSTPAGLTATPASNTRINLVWGASTDNVGVSGYRLERCLGAACTNFDFQVSTSGVTSYSDGGLSPVSTYRYRVRAVDAAGNLSGYSTVVSATTLSTPFPVGLVAAYGFEEGSGTTVSDVSGNGNTGTIVGASWTQGRYGGALSFNGTSSLVRIPSSTSLSLSTAMTLEAWVYPTAAQSGWRTIVQRDWDAYFLHASNANSALVPAGGGTFNGAEPSWVAGTAANAVNAWTHLAVTFDGAMLRLYVNGVQVASQAQTGSVETTASQVSIGGNGPWGEYFQGRIDEVRVYNRALSAAEIQADMNKDVSP